jgi:hypothetical protein
MRTLLYTVGVVILLAVAALGAGFTLEPQWRVERSAQIDSPPGPVFAYVSILRNWPEWTAWNTARYPELKYETSGPEWGVGATQSWDDGAMQGQLEVMDYRPGEYMEYELIMDDGRYRMRGSLSIESSGEGSRLTWAGWGETGNNPVEKLMMLAYRPLIGRDYEAGFDNLKKRFSHSSQEAGVPENGDAIPHEAHHEEPLPVEVPAQHPTPEEGGDGLEVPQE